jgi:hypothetical protein
VNDTKIDGKSSEIHFDADLLVKALRYHLGEAGKVDEGVLKNLPAAGFSARISRETWANLDDDHRLNWLLEASQRTGVKRVKALGIGSRLRGAKQN